MLLKMCLNISIKMIAWILNFQNEYLNEKDQDSLQYISKKFHAISTYFTFSLAIDEKGTFKIEIQMAYAVGEQE